MSAIDRAKAEHLRRMSEPEKLRLLRRQAERIEDERRKAQDNLIADLTAERLRREIIEAGEVPVA